MKVFKSSVLFIYLSLSIFSNLAFCNELSGACNANEILSKVFQIDHEHSEKNVVRLVHEFDVENIHKKNLVNLTDILTVKGDGSGKLLGSYYRPRKEIIEKLIDQSSLNDSFKMGKTFTQEKNSWLKTENSLEDHLTESIEKIESNPKLALKENERLKLLKRYLYEVKKGDLQTNEIERIIHQFVPPPGSKGFKESIWKDYLNDLHDFVSVNTKDKSQIEARFKNIVNDLLEKQNKNSALKKSIVKSYLDGQEFKAIDSDQIVHLKNEQGPTFLNEAYPDFESLPKEQSRLRMYIDSFSEVNSKENNLIIEKFYKQVFPSVSTQSNDIEKILIQKFPKIHQEKLLKYVASNDLKNIHPNIVREISSHQNQLEISLKKQLEDVIQANAPPHPWNQTTKNWAGYINELPANLREDFTHKLLIKNGTSAASITSIIEKLEPIEGVQDAVLKFLRESPLLSGSTIGFSQDQIRQMFRNGRFKKFFPWMPNGEIQGATRTQFVIAVFTNPKLESVKRLNLAWFRQKTLDSTVSASIPELIGFRPALDYSRMNTQLSENFAGSLVAKNPTHQLRGLIVQGEYEKNGSSLMTTTAERGALQVEQIAPRFSRTLESSLNDGVLSKADPLDRRLFVQNWSLAGTDQNLIERIRTNAIRLEREPNFWQLRVDIHNFPTMNELNRVKVYLANYKGSASQKAILERLANDLERFLGADQKSHATVNHLINNLSLREEGKLSLQEMAKNFENMKATDQLSEIKKLRKKFIDLKSNGNSSLKTTESYLGEKTFSDQAALISNHHLNSMKDLEKLKDPKEVSEFAKKIIDHLELDNVLEHSQVKSINDAIDSVIKTESLNSTRKIELLSEVLDNAVDQVYYKLLNRYGEYDDRIFRIGQSGTVPTRFIDSQMRKGPTFILSKLSDELKNVTSELKNATYEISGNEFKHPVQVFNAGEAVGILRLNKSPLQLTKNEIGVFTEMPTEMSPAAGMMTLGSGARLSHVQLLAKSLGIPNAKLSTKYLESLEKLDGKLIHFSATKEGGMAIHEISDDAGKMFGKVKKEIHVPEPNNSIKHPVAFSEARDVNEGTIAGPKGINLSKLFQDSDLKSSVPDGFILPFGYFKKYSDEIGLTSLLDLLGDVKLENTQMAVSLSTKIQKIIMSSKIPDEMLDEVLHALAALKKRTGHESGYFFRSDTHIEDLEGFNAAGLNESVPNVMIDRESVDRAIRQVWQSPFSEKSIYWRGMALQNENVAIAVPSVVVMPTVQAASSGVILSKGTEKFIQGKGKISANWGIGSVVESGRPVEEITLESGNSIRSSLTVSDTKPVAKESGGLEKHSITPGLPVLSESQIKELNHSSAKIEKVLGSKLYGYDIEWAYDSKGKLIILQARPNMK